MRIRRLFLLIAALRPYYDAFINAIKLSVLYFKLHGQQPGDEELAQCVAHYRPTRLHKAGGSRTTATDCDASDEFFTDRASGRRGKKRHERVWHVTRQWRVRWRHNMAAFIDKKLSCRGESARRSTAFERFLKLITYTTVDDFSRWNWLCFWSTTMTINCCKQSPVFSIVYNLWWQHRRVTKKPKNGKELGLLQNVFSFVEILLMMTQM